LKSFAARRRRRFAALIAEAEGFGGFDRGAAGEAESRRC
jgi:hypothetical protein